MLIHISKETAINPKFVTGVHEYEKKNEAGQFELTVVVYVSGSGAFQSSYLFEETVKMIEKGGA
ncbi:MAG TPA: hypothetical protein V6D12_14115 [Candidatus Obscuribacterales bacterium]